MKKLLLIAFMTVSLGCSKSKNPTPQQNSWIIGKWKATVRYSYNQSTQKTDTLTISNELTFNSDVVYENASNVGHIYKIDDSNKSSYINIYSGDCQLIKQTDSQFVLKSQNTSPDGLVIYNYTDVYNKE